MKIGGVKIVASLGAAQRQPFVNRTRARIVRFEHGVGAAGPGRDRPVLGGEDESRRRVRHDDEVGRVVEHDACRRSRRRGAGWRRDSDHQRLNRAAAVIEGGKSAVIV